MTGSTFSIFPTITTVLLKKPEAPISADFDYVAVEETITREEREYLVEHKKLPTEEDLIKEKKEKVKEEKFLFLL